MPLARLVTLVWALAVIFLFIQAADAESNILWFESPLDGTIVRPGDLVVVNIGVDDSVGANRVLLASICEPSEQELSGPPFQTAVVVPDDLAGPLELMAAATNTSGEWFGVMSITVQVVPADQPTAIQVMNQRLVFTLPDGALNPQRIVAFGEYSDGHSRSISNTSVGTTYESSSESIVTVDVDGYVYPLAPGVAYVTVRNGNAEEWVSVRVWDPIEGIGPALDVTASVAVSRSGLRIDPGSGLFVQNVTVANASTKPIAIPIVLVVDDLPAGVLVDNAVGKTAMVEPVGTPWLPMTSDAVLLRPGASLTKEVRFFNPDKLQITYTPRLFISTDP